MPDALSIFIPLTKVDVARGEVWGVMTAEAYDRSREILDYARSKPLIEAWSATVAKTSGGKSLGNVREQHNPQTAIGKLIALTFDDVAQAVTVGAKVVDPVALQKCEEGVLTGFSIGGAYADRWPDTRPGYTRYAPAMTEVSLVDTPCLPGATFTVLKADGTPELRKFATYEETAPMDVTAPAEPEAAAEETPVTPAVVAEVAPSPAQQLHDLLSALGMTCPSEDGDYDWPPYSAEQLVWRQVHGLLAGMGALCSHMEVVAVQKAAASTPIAARAAARVQAIHDHALALGATPRKADPAADEEAPADVPVAKALQAVHNVLLDADAIRLVPGTPQQPISGAVEPTPPAPDPAFLAQLTALQAQVTAQAATLAKALTDQAAGAARLAVLEATPLPGGPLVRAPQVVEKALGGLDEPPADPAPPLPAATRVLELQKAMAQTNNPAVRAELQEALRRLGAV